MKKVGNHNSIARKIFFGLALMLTFSFTSFAQSGDPVAGKALFNSNCAACHKLDAKATGPALRGIGDKYDAAWLHKWIKNSADLIKSGDADAIKVYEEFNKIPMTAFPQLSDEDLDNIIAYTMEPKAEVVAPAGATTGTAAASSDKKGTTRYREWEADGMGYSTEERCMKTGINQFTWVTIVLNSWSL